MSDDTRKAWDELQQDHPDLAQVMTQFAKEFGKPQAARITGNNGKTYFDNITGSYLDDRWFKDR